VKGKVVEEGGGGENRDLKCRISIVICEIRGEKIVICEEKKRGESLNFSKKLFFCYVRNFLVFELRE